MFKKLIAFVMILSMFTVSAQASVHSGLKAAFDELNYSLNVEWDQKDQNFYKKQVRTFNESVREMMNKGLTHAEFVAFVKSEVKDQKVAKDMETALSMISINNMTSADASKYMVETMEKSYSAGASWNGRGNVLLGVGILFVLAAVLVGGTTTSTYNTQTCGYSVYYCGETCYGYPYYYCDANYCCWY
jgi:hypothetical protein